MGVLTEELRRPRAGRVDQRSCRDLPRLAGGAAQSHPPLFGAALGIDAAPARQHRSAVLGRVDRIQHHQPRVIDPAVGIDEALAKARLQRCARCVLAQIDTARVGQPGAAGQVVVEEQPEADQPRGPHRRMVRVVGLLLRNDEAQPPHDVRRAAHQPFALGQGLAHQRELAVLQVAQPAVDQLGRRRRGVRRQIVLLAQQHPLTAAGQITGDAGAIDPATDDQHVDCSGVW